MTDNGQGLLDAPAARRVRVRAAADLLEPRLTQRMGRASFVGRVSYYAAPGTTTTAGSPGSTTPTGGIDNGFFAGRPIVDLGWCEDRGLGLGAIAPLHVAAYLDLLPHVPGDRAPTAYLFEPGDSRARAAAAAGHRVAEDDEALRTGRRTPSPSTRDRRHEEDPGGPTEKGQRGSS